MHFFDADFEFNQNIKKLLLNAEIQDKETIKLHRFYLNALDHF